MKMESGFSILSVKVSESVKNAFRSYVFDKHGTDKSMGFELDRILSDYLDRQPKGTHTQIGRSKNRAMAQVMDIVHAMKNEGYTNQVIIEKRVTEKGNIHWARSSDLGSIVSNVKGTDQRSIDKYVNILIDLGILTNPVMVPNSRKLIFSINFDAIEDKKSINGIELEAVQ